MNVARGEIIWWDEQDFEVRTSYVAFKTNEALRGTTMIEFISNVN